MTEFIAFECGSCGGKLQIEGNRERFACSYCGKEYVTKRAGDAVSFESRFACPICGKDDRVEKVSGITSKPELLLPPEPDEPQKESFSCEGCLISILSVSFFVSTSVIFLYGVDRIRRGGVTSIYPLALVAFAGIIALGAFLFIVEDRIDHRRAQDQYRKARNEYLQKKRIRDALLKCWRLFYYCHRNDVIFYRDPNTDEVKYSNDVEELAFM